MTQIATSEADTSSRPQTPPGLVDVKIDKPTMLRVGHLVGWGFVGLLYLLVILLIGALLSVPGAYVTLALSSIAAIGITISVAQRNHKKNELEVRRLIREKTPGEAVAYLASHLYVFGPGRLKSKLLSELVAYRADVPAIRAHWSKDVSPLQPLDVNFPPISLNESDEQFVQLMDATSNPTSKEDSPAGRLRVSSEETEIGRLVRRNFRLKGGWFVLAMCTFNLVIAALEAYQQMQVTLRLLLWTIALLGYLFITPRRETFKSGEWLMVPGGLVRRIEGKDPSKSEVALFSPYTSILIARQAMKESWYLAITNEHDTKTIALTARETDMALRAWLSPIPPPSVDKLVDLT